jgi:hypothetical protein
LVRTGSAGVEMRGLAAHFGDWRGGQGVERHGPARAGQAGEDWRRPVGRGHDWQAGRYRRGVVCSGAAGKGGLGVDRRGKAWQ